MTTRGALCLALFLGPAALPAGAGVEDPFAECEAQVRSQPQGRESYRCFYMKARQKNLFAEAALRLEAYLSLDSSNHWARLALANLEDSRGGTRAESLYRESIRGFAASRVAMGEVYARLGLATSLAHGERMPEAEAELETAWKAAEASGEKLLLATVRLEQARQLWRQQKDLGRAYRQAREAEAFFFPDGPYQQQLTCLHVLSGVCSMMDRYQEGAEYDRRLIALVHEAGDLHVEATVRYNQINRTLDHLERIGAKPDAGTLKLAREALAAAVGGGNRWAEGATHRVLGDLEPERAARLEHYRQCLASAREMKESEGIGHCLRGLALAAFPDDPEGGYRTLQEAADLARRSADRWEIYQALRVAAAMRWKAGPRDRAVADSLAAIDSFESIRDLQIDEEARAGLLSKASPSYYRLSGHLLEPPGSQPSQEDLQLAFQVMERLRARVLLEGLDAGGARPALLPGPLQEERNAVLGRIAAVQKKLLNAQLPEPERLAGLRQLDELERQEGALRAQAIRRSPAFAALRKPVPPTLAEVREALAPEEALLTFQLSALEASVSGAEEGGSWVLVFTRGEVRSFPLPERTDLEPGLEAFLGLFGRRDKSEAPLAAALYQRILRVPLAHLPEGVRKLVLVPDGLLHRLPFDALRASPDEPPLAARYELSLAPSVATWLRWRNNRRPAAPWTALALADPETGSESSSPGDPASSRERGWLLATSARLGPLPHARSEARSLIETLGGSSRLRVGPQASERFVKEQDLTRFALTHFAAHAVLDEREPERTGILLAPGSEREDGLLQVRELVGLDFSGRLVVLSACRSAGGALLKGEGVMSLARAFFQAGASSVVGSLWPVRDDEAARLMGAFYPHLADGMSVASSLAAAKRDLLRDGAPAAAWAGIVVLGDGDLIPFPEGKAARGARGPSRLLVSLLLAGGVALGIFLWSRRSMFPA